MSYPQTLDISTADFLSVTNVAAKFATLVMLSTAVYRYVCTVDSWIKQGASADTPTASAAALSAFIPASQVVFLDGKYGDTLSAIRQGGSSGSGSLCQVAIAKVG